LHDWQAQRHDLFNHADASLTQAQAAITATGTLMLESSPQNPRTLSLVPPIHVVIVYRDTLYGTLNDALQRYHGKKLPANVVLVSGPSKTADVQQTLAYGAHGPRELIIYLCG
jgi:L-lactate dehydrogenase complex protein LldG